MDKVVDGVPVFNLWSTAHPEETKSGSQSVKITRGPFVSERKAFFESQMKLPVTKEQAKCGRIPKTLKVCKPKTAATSIVESVQGPCNFLKSEECNRCPNQNAMGKSCLRSSPVKEKRRQLIGLYQAICEKVRQSPYDLRQNILENCKEKTSSSLQDRLRCLLIEESNSREKKELRSKWQNLEPNDHSFDSTSERHLSLKPLKKYQRSAFLESESAVNCLRTNSIPRAPEVVSSRQMSLPLDKAHGQSILNSTANNEFQQNHRDICSRNVWGNPANEHYLTYYANQDFATGKPVNPEIANKLTAAHWPTDLVIGPQSDIRIGFSTHSVASEGHSALPDKSNSLHYSANQRVSRLAKCCEAKCDQEPKGKVCSDKLLLNELFLEENPHHDPVQFPVFPVKIPVINETCKQQKEPAASRLHSTAEIDRLEKRPSQSDPSLVLCSPQKLKINYRSHHELMNSETGADDDTIRSQSDNSTEESKAKIQFKSMSLTKLNDDGAQEFDSSYLNSLAQASNSDLVSSASTTLSQMEDIRQLLQSLEADYQKLVALLSRDSRTPLTHRKLKQKGLSTVKNGKLWAQLKLQRQKDICTVQRKFAHLEAHILLLVRNIAQLTEEIGSQNALIQKVLSFQLEIKKTQQACNEEVGDQHGLSMKQDSPNVSECSLYCGERPSIMTMFLKKLGYEHFAPLFENAGISLAELPYLDENNLQKLGIPTEARIHILQEVRCTTYV
ncbi:uncharacterized protein LOC134357276 isoform X2 [Mobula hypostoma]|uniref:uncharacterized protein LOC134357276 isoform X2 n=1 Tax=Mobula hypostoma TaxID=723540 RepID=UPI002FC38AF3